jgi:hypothetical protein
MPAPGGHSAMNAHGGGGGEQTKRRSWQLPATQAPQSQSPSALHARCAQWCGLWDALLQSELGGHLKPLVQEMGAQPWASLPVVVAQFHPVGQV